MVPYRLPELLAVSAKRNGHPTRVYIVEGEKDADCLTTLWGLLSTTNPRGAGKWRKDFNRHFSGFDVVITSDNDDAGRKHAHDVATSLCSVAASVRIVELGGLPEKGDISDWIANGATQSDLETLVEITPPFRPSGPIPAEDADDPVLCEHPASQPISSIPPRQWAYGHFLLFGHAAVLGAVDGGGKGAHATAIALSMITGRPLLGERVWRAGPVAIITYEDDQIEWCRRIAAACLHYDINYETVITSFYFLNRSRSRIRLAAHSPTGDIVFPDGDDIIARLNTIGAVLLIVDPFNHAHSTEDGKNNAVIAATCMAP
jgi:hypothetical protein